MSRCKILYPSCKRGNRKHNKDFRSSTQKGGNVTASL
ncbi:hypothetical protein CR513_03606 [Mucuna pruriens]|uniref:Uncharacterized protein n=1 Tax=Mucuna pruriens TaxID=157652 RepID=A0A371I9J5_MUCPR|nr:hypothetical protein CR513_03606 [Mucuna pruriens]